MSASEAIARTKQGVEGLVAKTAEVVTPASDEDLNPWKKTPMVDTTEHQEVGDELTKEDFEKAAAQAQQKVDAARQSVGAAWTSVTGGATAQKGARSEHDVPVPEINEISGAPDQTKKASGESSVNKEKGTFQKLYEAASDKLNPVAHAAGPANESHLDKARDYAGKSGKEAEDSVNYLGKAGSETAQAARDAAGRTAERAEDKAEDAKQATSGYLGKVKDSITGLWHQAEGKSEELADSARQTVNQAGDKMAEGRDTAYAKASEAADRGKAAAHDSHAHWRETANDEKDGADKARQDLVDRLSQQAGTAKDTLTEEKDKAKDSLTEQKEQAKGSVQEGSDKAQETGSNLVGSLRDSINRVFGHAQEKTQKAGDKLQDTAADARQRTPDSREAQAKTEDFLEGVKESAAHTKDATVDAFKYVAGRFTAPVSGDENTDRSKADELKGKVNEAKDKASGERRSFFDSFKPKQGGHDVGKEAQERRDNAKEHAKSALEQASEAVRARTEQVKVKVQHAVEQAEEDFYPKTYEEELQSSGYIPSNTADTLAHKDEEQDTAPSEDPQMQEAFTKSAMGYDAADPTDDVKDSRTRI